MGNNSINDTQMSVKTIKTLEEIKALNVSGKTKDFLSSVFNELDITDAKGKKNADKILQQNEGSIYVFGDGSVSITKNGKFYAGTSAQGAEVRAVGDTLNVSFSDGSKSVMKDDKLVSGTTNNGRAYTVKDGNIVFDKTEPSLKEQKTNAKQQPATQEPKAVEEKPKAMTDEPKAISESAKVQKTEKADNESSEINGVDKTLLDNIAKEYQNLTRSDYKLKDKLKFYLKYSDLFSRALNKIPRSYTMEQLKTYKPEILETDKYTMEFSPSMNLLTHKFYWELYDVREKQ